MDKSQMTFIDCMTPLIVYTLEFREHAEEALYTIDKLVEDYDKLISDAQKSCTLGEDAFHAALFPMVAWIDETILNSPYSDKKLWRKRLLQKKFFNTSQAGLEFFTHLNELDKSASALRFIYLYCLFLGFKGEYYRNEDAKVLDALFIAQKELLPDTFIESFPKFAFNKAYAQHQLPAKKPFGSSYLGIWMIIAVSLIVALVLFLASQAYLNGLLDQYNIF